MELSSTLDHLPAVTWTTDLDLRLTALGGALGAHAEAEDAVPRLALYRLLQTADRDFPPVAAHRRALRGESASFDGIWRDQPYHARVDPLRDADGAIVGTIGVAVPVAEAEPGLLDPLSEPSIRAILEGAAIGVSVVDLHHRVLAVNHALEEMLGYRSDELRGVNVARFTHPDDVGVGHGLLDELVRGQRDHYRVDKRYVRKDGQVLSVRLAVSLVRDAAGRPQFVVGMVEDVTEHTRADRELLLLQALTLAISDAPDFVAALSTTIREVCEHTGWGYGQAWIPSEDGAYIDPSPAWYSRSPRYESFRLVSSALRFAPGLGLPGRVWASRDPVLIPDVMEDDEFLRREPAQDAGLGTAVGVPVVADDAVVAVLEFLTATAGPDTRRLVGLVSALGTQLGSLLQRKRAEEGLKSAEARFRMLVEIAPDIIFSVDVDTGAVTALNPAWESITGWPVDEWIGAPYSALVHPDDQALAAEVMECARHGETPDPFELRILEPSGDYMIGEVRVELRGDGDHVLEMIGIARDVTGRRHDEERLRETNQLLSAIVTGSPIGIVTAGRDARVTSYNPAAERILGWPAAEVVGRAPRPGGDNAATRHVIERVLRGETVADIELERSRRDGSSVVLNASAAPLRGPNGEVTGLVATFTDVTGRRSAERALAATNAALDERTRLLEATVRQQEAFIFSVSHDLKTPLISIQGLASLLLDDLERGSGGQPSRYAERIVVNAARMQRLLTDLLVYSRIGRVDGEPETVPLGGVVAEVVEQLSDTIARRGGTVLTVGELPTVWGSRPRLVEALHNLVDNALHYTPPDRDPEVRVAATDRGDRWEVMVADNGRGIPEVYHQRVLGMFQRLPGAEELKPDGTGLGLTIVARIVEVHGGQLWLESAESGGTTVHFTLPKHGDHAATGMLGEPPVVTAAI
ncbi:MAG TPA: PAS domain S-box protein [Thermomicrobiaceae bacterium]|nr:PAS domain S-box protein [Thermomicrobiaceae bacterium]